MRPVNWLLGLLLGLSMVLNVLLIYEVNEEKARLASIPSHIVWPNANSRPTYFTVHNIKEAQTISKGKGVKVGLLDSFFGLSKHSKLYAGGRDFLNNPDTFLKIDEHGYWMALVLREIAPEVEIYALNTMAAEEERKTAAMCEAIDWAIENNIDILTYSSAAFTPANRRLIDQAVERAVDHGIVTVFIHYPHPANIWPAGMSLFPPDLERQPDINVLPYDYNVLFIKNRGDNVPDFISMSSTAPVTAGVVALLKSIAPGLSPAELKEILVATAHTQRFGGELVPQVMDAQRACLRALQRE